MINQQQPITPTPELVRNWARFQNEQDPEALWLRIGTLAARWGADQQLAEDAKWLDQHALDAPHLKITPVGESLIEAMRPKPPSLKEQALAKLPEHPESMASYLSLSPGSVATIRRALEALDE